MIKDTRPLDCLNISVKYVSHWSYLHGLRELYQNFMDSCLEKYPQFKLMHRKEVGTNEIKYIQARRAGINLELIQGNFILYDKSRMTLTFENQKYFPIKCLLMGCSEKGPEALGQFGQGLKLSMIVLLKAGFDISISSGQFIYFPTIKSWDHNELYAGKYEHEVLYIKVESQKFSDKTRVTIDNINENIFEDFQYLSLALLDDNKYDLITCGPSTLIFPKDPKLIGKIYKKGVRLEFRQSQNSQKFVDYSYNFQTIQVGRDRNCANNVWDLYKLQSELHYRIVRKNFDENFLKNHPQFRPKLKQHLSNLYKYLREGKFVTWFFNQFSSQDQPVCDLMYDKFMEKHNNLVEIYPSYGDVKITIFKNLQLYGLQSTFYPTQDNISWQLQGTLVHSTKYMSIQQKIDEQILSKQVRQLTPDESAILEQIKQNIGDCHLRSLLIHLPSQALQGYQLLQIQRSPSQNKSSLTRKNLSISNNLRKMLQDAAATMIQAKYYFPIIKNKNINLILKIQIYLCQAFISQSSCQKIEHSHVL